MRLIVISAVDQGAEACNGLYHRSIIALAEGIGCQLRGTHIVFIINNAVGSRLTLKINIGFQSKIKDMLKFHEIIDSHGLSHPYHGDVAGILYPLLDSGRTVSPSVMASDLFSADLHDSLAVIAFRSHNTAALNSCGNRKGLGNGSRLIGVGNTEILPQSVQMLIHFLIRIQIGKIFFRNIIHPLSLLVEKVHTDQRLRISGIIEVIIGVAGHSQNLPGIYLHNNAAHILGRISGMISVL